MPARTRARQSESCQPPPRARSSSQRLNTLLLVRTLIQGCRQSLASNTARSGPPGAPDGEAHDREQRRCRFKLQSTSPRSQSRRLDEMLASRPSRYSYALLLRPARLPRAAGSCESTPSHVAYARLAPVPHSVRRARAVRQRPERSGREGHRARSDHGAPVLRAQHAPTGARTPCRAIARIVPCCRARHHQLRGRSALAPGARSRPHTPAPRGRGALRARAARGSPRDAAAGAP